jgi:TRAP-type C4-dicarboxylate transport system permease small subunit
LKVIKKIFDLLEAILENLAMIFLVFMTIIIIGQVFTRYFLNFTAAWSEEVALILMVWFGFIGIALGVKRRTHLAIEYFVSLLNDKAQTIVFKYIDLTIIFFGAVLAYNGFKLVEVTKASTMAGTGLPASTLYLMVPISGIMIVIYSLLKLLGIDKDVIINEDIQNIPGNEVRK